MLNLMVLSILTPFIGGVLIYLVKNKSFNFTVFVFQSFETFIVYKLIVYYCSYGDYCHVIGGWGRNVGIELGVDRITVLFLLITVFLWWIVLLYMWPQRGTDVKHVFFLLVLEGMFVGLLLSRDLFNMFLFIEVISMISAILITYHKDAKSVKAGLYYLLFNNFGMMVFLLGIILIYYYYGTLNMSSLKAIIEVSKDVNVLNLAFVFFVTSMGVKAAFFPVYNWLPNAHAAAPSHISAILSGLLVKSGLYGFMRISNLFNNREFDTYFLVVGLITAVGGVFFAMIQKDIKMVLGYHTISQVGLIFTSLSYPSTVAQDAGFIHLLNHAVFKSLLFLGAGMVVNMYGTRYINNIRGLFKRAPIVSIGLIVGSLAITGFPLFSGYVGKHLFLEAFHENLIVYIIIELVNLGTVVSFIKLSTIHFGNSEIARSPLISIHQEIAIVILAIISILSFPFLMLEKESIWGLSRDSYVNTTLIRDIFKYLIFVILGFSFYLKIIRKDYKFFKRMRNLNLSFETSNFLFVFFIFTMIAFWVAK